MGPRSSSTIADEAVDRIAPRRRTQQEIGAMEAIAESIRGFIARNIIFSNSGYPHPDDTSFLESGIVDSMNVMELVMYSEEAFGIRVNDDEIVPGNFDSVSNLVSYIRRKKGQA
jgi:acyl carrier protein